MPEENNKTPYEQLLAKIDGFKSEIDALKTQIKDVTDFNAKLLSRDSSTSSGDSNDEKAAKEKLAKYLQEH